MESDLATLCQSCGMCCDGSLFGVARLEPDEVSGARKNRLPVLDSERGFHQPCPALAPVGDTGEGQRGCSIYEERPRACRSFTCRLLARFAREGGPLEPRMAAVRRVRELVAFLDSTGLRPPDFDGERAGGSPAADAFTELMACLERDFARA
jgi:uncharacterized protein